MFEVVDFKREHLMGADVSEETIEAMERTDANTIVYKGKPLVCGGVGLIWPGRGLLWTVFTSEAKEHFVPTFRGIQKFLEMKQEKYRRIELSIDFGPWHEVGCRRAELLGFSLECARAKKYLPDGLDCSLYALVRE